MTTAKVIREFIEKRNKEQAKLEKQKENKEVQKYLAIQEELRRLDFGVKEWTETAASKTTNWLKEGKTETANVGKGIIITRTTRSVRQILAQKMVMLHPFLVNILVESGKVRIPVTEVEKELSKEDLEKIIERKTEYKYDVKLVDIAEEIKVVEKDNKERGRKKKLVKTT